MEARTFPSLEEAVCYVEPSLIPPPATPSQPDADNGHAMPAEATAEGSRKNAIPVARDPRNRRRKTARPMAMGA